MSATPIRVYGPSGEEVADIKSNTNKKPRGLNLLHSGGGSRGASPVLYRRHSDYEGQSPKQCYNDDGTPDTPIRVYGPTGEEVVDIKQNNTKKTGGLNLLHPSGSRGASPLLNRRHSDFGGLSPKQRSRHNSFTEPVKELLHNFLHPIDFIHQRKSRSRTTSECSENLDDVSSSRNLRSLTPEPGVKKKKKYFTKPVEKNKWPVYQPQTRRRPTPLQAQLSCPGPSSSPKINTTNQQVEQRHTNLTRSDSSGSNSSASSSECSCSDEECRHKGQNNSSDRSLRTPLNAKDSLPQDFGIRKSVSCRNIPDDDVPFNPEVHSYRDSSSVRYEMEKSIGPRFGVENVRKESYDEITSGTDNNNGYASSRLKKDSVPEVGERKQSDTEILYSIYDQILGEGQYFRSHSVESENKQKLSIDSSSGETDHPTAMLFRDSKGLPAVDPLLENINHNDLDKDGINSFVKFFKYHHCFDLIPYIGKIVAFDTTLKAKEAFHGLTYNGVRAALLWDQIKKTYVGILTITDFIRILQNFYAEPNREVEELEEQCLQTWRSVLKDEAHPLISIAPDASLYEAIHMLMHHKIHRLPVIDHCTGNVLHIITHKRVMRFLYLYINELPKPFRLQQTLAQVKIGTYNNIETAHEETTIIEALNKFVEHRVSALPIVDDNGKLIDIYAKFDVMNLAAQKTYNNLDLTLKEANKYRNGIFEQVHHCTLTETLGTIMERIVLAGVHRLVVVDEEDKVIGVISLSDILKELVLRPCGDEDPLSLKTARISEMEAALFLSAEEEFL